MAIPQTTAISSLINQCQFIEEQTQGALIKAFRQACGQFKSLAVSVANGTGAGTNTVLLADPELSLTVKAGVKYQIDASFVIVTNGTAGAKFQVNLPANVSNTVFEGVATFNVAGTITTSVLNNNSSLNATLFNAASNLQLVTIQGFLIPTVDDVMTFSTAQNTSNAVITGIGRGSQVIALAYSTARRAPSTV